MRTNGDLVWIYGVEQDGTRSEGPTGQGVFLGWGVDHELYDYHPATTGTFTVAIVEDDNGDVQLFHPRLIRFGRQL